MLVCESEIFTRILRSEKIPLNFLLRFSCENPNFQGLKIPFSGTFKKMKTKCHVHTFALNTVVATVQILFNNLSVLCRFRAQIIIKLTKVFEVSPLKFPVVFCTTGNSVEWIETSSDYLIFIGYWSSSSSSTHMRRTVPSKTQPNRPYSIYGISSGDFTCYLCLLLERFCHIVTNNNCNNDDDGDDGGGISVLETEQHLDSNTIRMPQTYTSI